MSWDSYIDNTMAQCQNSCDRVAIIGLDGAKWTSDAHPSNFKLNPSEAKVIATALQTGDYSVFQCSGINAEGVKYNFLRGTEDGFLGKKKDNGAIVVAKSNTGFVIGHVKEGSAAGSVSVGVSKIASYLISLNM